MLRSKSCRNCASGNFKCKKSSCLFRTMRRSDYNAVRNHLGREMFEKHIESMEASNPTKRNKLWRALIGACKWWKKDDVKGTFGEITRREREDTVIARIVVQMSKALTGTPVAATTCYEVARDFADNLTPHHPVRLALAVAQAQHHSSLNQYARASEIALEAIGAMDEHQLTDEANELFSLLIDKLELWN